MAKKSPAKKASTPRRGRSSGKVKSAATVDSGNDTSTPTSEKVDNQKLSVSSRQKKVSAVKNKSKRKRESPSDTDVDEVEDSDDDSAALPSVSPKKKIRFYSQSPTQSDEDFLATSDSEGASEGVSDGDSDSSVGKTKGKRQLTEDNKARRTPRGRKSVTKSRKGKGKMVDSSDTKKSLKTKKGTSSDEEQSIAWSDSDADDDVFTSKPEQGKGTVGHRTASQPTFLSSTSGDLKGAIIMGSTPESEPSPETCEVMNDPTVIADKDKGLKYGDLPKLRSKKLYIYGLESRDGNIIFSQWKTHLPKANLTMAKRFLTFSDSGIYINISRVDPAILFVRQAFGTSKTKNLTNSIGSLFLCLTPVMCIGSSLINPRPAPTKAGNPPRVYKFIAGVLHTVEYDRFAAAMGMAWRVKGMHAPMTNNAMSFTTRSETEESVATSYLSTVTAPKMFSPRKSSSSTSSGVFNKIRSSLGAHENVPVYDGRKKTFNVDSKALDSIDTLPKFVGEVPAGSLIVVAYTAGAYDGPNSIDSLSLNVNWVLLLGSKE